MSEDIKMRFCRPGKVSFGQVDRSGTNLGENGSWIPKKDMINSMRNYS